MTADAQHDNRGRVRCVYLPEELWDWIDAVAQADDVTRSDFVEGLVLLAQDDRESQ